MMIRRIVVDTVRRMWTLYAVAVSVVVFFAWVASRPFIDEISSATKAHVFAWSMAASWFLACWPTFLLETREILRLPVSRREMWVARWWLSVVVPAVAIAVALAGGTVAALPIFNPERFLLAIVYCVLYCGCFMTVSALVPLDVTSRPRSLAATLVLTRLVVIPLGGAMLPLWFAKYLPQTFGNLLGPAMGTLIAAVGVTIASYLNRPVIAARPGRARVMPLKTPAASRRGMLDGLSGLTFLAVKEGRKALLMYSCLLALVVVFWGSFDSESLASFLRNGSALVFSKSPESPSTGFPVVAMFILAGVSDVGLMGDMRNLRALPISVTRLSAILTSLTVMTTAVLWAVLLGAQLLVLHTLPSSMRPDLFLVILGSLAVSHSMRLAWPAVGAARAAAGAVTMVPLAIVCRWGYAPGGSWIRAAMIAGGSAVLVLSWWINVRTLRRGSRIYKMKPPPLAAISS